LPEVQAFIEEWKDAFGAWPQPPEFYIKGDTFYPPVSAEQMLVLSDDTLMKLFRFYDETKVQFRSYDFLEEGTKGVIAEFRKCCSMNPARFLRFIEQLYGKRIYPKYAVALMEGVATHLLYRFGRLRRPQEWKPVEPLSDGPSLASFLLKWLGMYPNLWTIDGRAVATALQACCYVIESPSDVELLTLFLSRLAYHREPEEDQNDLEYLSLNSVRGKAAEGAINLAIRLMEKEQELPELLFPLLLRFAKDPVAGVRVSLLFSLPAFTYHELERGWQLFEAVFEESNVRLWRYAGKFLYYQYYHHFSRVHPYLEHMKAKGLEITGGIWSRIQTLAYLSGHITESQLFDELVRLNHKDVWSGASLVFSTNIDKPEHRSTCEKGILRALQTETLPAEILSEIDGVFHKLSTDGSETTIVLAESFIMAFQDEKELCNRVWFFDWIASLSEHAPLAALHLCETFLDKIETSEAPCRIFHGDGLVSAYLQIMREADISDDPEIIERAISLQDRLLKLNLPGMWDALDKAGRD